MCWKLASLRVEKFSQFFIYKQVAMACILTTIPCVIQELSGFMMIQSATTQIQMLVLGGVALTMLFQILTIGLAGVATATTVGILGQAKM